MINKTDPTRTAPATLRAELDAYRQDPTPSRAARVKMAAYQILYNPKEYRASAHLLASDALAALRK